MSNSDEESIPLVDEEQGPTRRRWKFSPKYILGLAMIGGVVVIWVAASALVQYIYDNLDWHGPFFLTYVSNSLFTIYLPLFACHAAWRTRARDPIPLSATDELASVNQRGGKLPSYDTEADGGADLGSASSASSSEAFSGALADAGAAGGTDAGSEPSALETGFQRSRLTLKQTARASLIVCPIWFMANYTYNASLASTSLSINTILSTSSSLFTFALSVCALGERITLARVAGVLAAMLGSALVSVADSISTGGNTLGGDMLCLLAGFLYGCYTVTMRRLLPDDDLVSMPLFFGILGLFNFLMLGGIVLALNFTGVEPLSALSWRIFGLICVKGLVDNVLSDYLWARAVLLTSATVATVGLSLTVPLAMLSDLLLHGDVPSLISVVGALLVIAGFIGVNIDAPPVPRSAEAERQRVRCWHRMECLCCRRGEEEDDHVGHVVVN